MYMTQGDGVQRPLTSGPSGVAGRPNRIFSCCIYGPVSGDHLCSGTRCGDYTNPSEAFPVTYDSGRS
jgi:hypothetical protein